MYRVNSRHIHRTLHTALLSSNIYFDFQLTGGLRYCWVKQFAGCVGFAHKNRNCWQLRRLILYSDYKTRLKCEISQDRFSWTKFFHIAENCRIKIERHSMHHHGTSHTWLETRSGVCAPRNKQYRATRDLFSLLNIDLQKADLKHTNCLRMKCSSSPINWSMS